MQRVTTHLCLLACEVALGYSIMMNSALWVCNQTHPKDFHPTDILEQTQFSTEHLIIRAFVQFFIEKKKRKQLKMSFQAGNGICRS